MTHKSYYLVTWQLVMAPSAYLARQEVERALGHSNEIVDCGIEACVEAKSRADIDRANAKACLDVVRRDRTEQKAKKPDLNRTALPPPPPRTRTRQVEEGEDGLTTGERVRMRREELGIRPAELARRVGISKGYLWQIEQGAPRKRGVGGDILYRLAVELGTTPGDLLGRVVVGSEPTITPELTAMGRQFDLTDDDLAMLATINYRGRKPSTVLEWWFIWESIRRTLT